MPNRHRPHRLCAAAPAFSSVSNASAFARSVTVPSITCTKPASSEPPPNSVVAAYLDAERPVDDVEDEFVFVVLKGPHRGRPLTPKGLEEILRGARERAGLGHATCHELRHTCLTRLREAGMALEAVQAQAGHRSIESTRVYLHLANDWLAHEYRKVSEAIDAQVMLDNEMSAS
jgi:hypothetical protein